MNKQILTIDFEIPGYSENNVEFYDSFSLMDADILVISPDSINPKGQWISFTGGGGCYDVDSSKRFLDKMSHLKKELSDYLSSGRSVFVLLTSKEEFQLAQSVTSLRKGENTYNTKTACNYDFLPVDIGTLISLSGKHVKFCGNSIFSSFDKQFNRYLEYQLYIESPKVTQVVYSGKDKNKILGAFQKVSNGHLIVLPVISFDEFDFTDSEMNTLGEEDEFWNKKGLAFGNSLIKSLVDIDTQLTAGIEKTPPPEWTKRKQYLIAKEILLNEEISKNLVEIERIEMQNQKLKIEFANEVKLKDLLFEKGKLLEAAVIEALKLLGYEAEGYNDGNLEIDQIIISPENYRYIGECEGKDSKDIDVTKFRQLQDALNADFARDEVEEKAFGILFGNAERLKDPGVRKLDFTIKCKSGAQREKIALIKTTDLFHVCKYLTENNDPLFKKACRLSIHENLGQVIIFPMIPCTVNKEEATL